MQRDEERGCLKRISGRLSRYASTLPAEILALVKQAVRYLVYRAVTLQSAERSADFITQDLPIKRIIYINLDQLSSYLTRAKDSEEPLYGKELFAERFIVNGDWDLNYRPVMPHYYDQDHKRAISFRSTFQVFRDGVPYRECDEYKKKMQGDCGYLPLTEMELAEKYKNLRLLFEEIKAGGYKSQKELKKTRKHWDDEIRVAIGRDGQLYKIAESGNHRLAMALILDIDRVPVYVQGVHRQWALKCRQKHARHLLEAINRELDRMNLKNHRKTGWLGH